MLTRKQLEGKLGGMLGSTRQLKDEISKLNLEESKEMLEILSARKVQARHFKRHMSIKSELEKYVKMLEESKDKDSEYIEETSVSVNIEEIKKLSINCNSLVLVDYDNVRPSAEELQSLANYCSVIVFCHLESDFNKLNTYNLTGKIKINFVNSNAPQSVDMAIHNTMFRASMIGAENIIVISRDRGYDACSKINNLNISRVDSVEYLLKIDEVIRYDYSQLFNLPKEELTNIVSGNRETILENKNIDSEALNKLKLENAKLNDDIESYKSMVREYSNIVDNCSKINEEKIQLLAKLATQLQVELSKANSTNKFLNDGEVIVSNNKVLLEVSECRVFTSDDVEDSLMREELNTLLYNMYNNAISESNMKTEKELKELSDKFIEEVNSIIESDTLFHAQELDDDAFKAFEQDKSSSDNEEISDDAFKVFEQEGNLPDNNEIEDDDLFKDFEPDELFKDFK